MHRAGQLDVAAGMYRQLVQEDRRNSDASYGLGTVLLQKGEYEEALELLEHAVAVSPDVPQFAFNLACALQKTGKTAGATQYFMQAANLAGADPELLAEICKKLMDLGFQYAARNLLLSASKRLPESRIIFATLARALARVRDYRAAIATHEKALGMAPPAAQDMLAHADLLFMARQPDAATVVLQQARTLGADGADVLYLEARCERLAGRLDRAHALLHEAIEQRPSYGDAWQLLLEHTPDEQLPQLADRCTQIAADTNVKVRDRIMLSYTSGRARERLSEYGDAFEQFSTANQLQRNDAQSRGVGYDAEKTELFIERMRSEFDSSSRHTATSPPDTQPIFIVGMPRSGTTLVEKICGGFAGISTGGESEALELVASQNYWALDHGRAKPIRDLEPSDWDELAQQYWQLQMGERRRLTDKLPTNFQHVGLICGMFPDSPVIYLQRDPRDVALSIYSRFFPDGHSYATDHDSLAHYVSASQQHMAHWKSLYPQRIFELRYERLIDEPERQTQLLAEFCNVEWHPDCLNFHQRTDASYTFSEMQVREPLNPKGIGRWRKYADHMQPFIESFTAHGVRLED